MFQFLWMVGPTWSLNKYKSSKENLASGDKNLHFPSSHHSNQSFSIRQGKPRNRQLIFNPRRQWCTGLADGIRWSGMEWWGQLKASVTMLMWVWVGKVAGRGGRWSATRALLSGSLDTIHFLLLNKRNLCDGISWEISARDCSNTLLFRKRVLDILTTPKLR